VKILAGDYTPDAASIEIERPTHSAMNPQRARARESG
jgi:hypothetical protein